MPGDAWERSRRIVERANWFYGNSGSGNYFTQYHRDVRPGKARQHITAGNTGVRCSCLAGPGMSEAGYTGAVAPEE
jgi:hypothetical protein